MLDHDNIVLRALALRKLRKIGALWAESGQFWISTSEYDPYGSRFRVSLAELAACVEAIEAGGPLPEKIPVQRETTGPIKAWGIA